MQVLPHSGYLSVVLVGLGHIGAKHAVVLAQHPRIRLVATVDPLHAGRTGVFADLSGEVLHGTDLGTMLDGLDAQVDAGQRLVLVATPNGTHIPLALLAVERGWHVLVEKPMGLDPVACADLVDVARSRGRVLAVAMQNRFGRAARALKELVDRGLLGDLRMVQIECLWNRDGQYYNASAWRGTQTMDGGVLFTQFSHFIDLLLWLLGRPIDFSLLASNQAHPGLELNHDSGVLSMRWPRGMLGTMIYTTAAPAGGATSGVTILGSVAGVRLTGQYMDRLEWLTHAGVAMTNPELMAATFSPDGQSLMDLSDLYTKSLAGDGSNTRFLMWDHLCGVILDKQALLLPPEDALEVVRFIHDIHLSRL
jgi:predicted dehydrogenase